MNSHQQSDIIIIGAGPAGLALAKYFQGSDLNITLLEKSPLEQISQPNYDGREIALTHHSKEILQNLGIWQHIKTDDIYPLKDAKVYSGDLNYALHFQVPKSLGQLSSIDRLGNLISNHNIRQALYDQTHHLPNVNLICDAKVSKLHTDDTGVQVWLADGRTFSAKLLVGADSRLSFVRRELGISADMHDFGRTVIVFRVSHPLSNQACAQECFLQGQTLALLPLTDTLTNCVITVDNTQSQEFLSLSPDALLAKTQRLMQDRLGKLTLAGTIHHYPLMGVHANHFIAKRAALIGDAAVGMHPVTAHGYNLGLMSVDTLGSLVQNAHRLGKDIGNDEMLASYQRKHRQHTLPLYHGTNAMVRLFTNDSKPARLLRDVALRVSNNLPPVKHWIAHQLTGK